MRREKYPEEPEFLELFSDILWSNFSYEIFFWEQYFFPRGFLNSIFFLKYFRNKKFSWRNFIFLKNSLKKILIPQTFIFSRRFDFLHDFFFLQDNTRHFFVGGRKFLEKLFLFKIYSIPQESKFKQISYSNIFHPSSLSFSDSYVSCCSSCHIESSCF